MGKDTRKQHLDPTIRTFICIEIPDSIKQRIGELQDSLRKIEAQISWTKPQNIHLTLKFLGPVAESRILRVKTAVERATNSIKPFEVIVGEAGCFPSPRSPRVLWVGVSAVPPELRDLYSNIDYQLSREGFEKEKRRFSPHLTIGRVRTPRNASQVAETLIETGFAPEAFIATEVIVMSSDLKPTGSIYTPQAKFRLQAE